jgi:hypothetical protein
VQQDATIQDTLYTSYNYEVEDTWCWNTKFINIRIETAEFNAAWPLLRLGPMLNIAHNAITIHFHGVVRWNRNK